MTLTGASKFVDGPGSAGPIPAGNGLAFIEGNVYPSPQFIHIK